MSAGGWPGEVVERVARYRHAAMRLASRGLVAAFDDLGDEARADALEAACGALGPVPPPGSVPAADHAAGLAEAEAARVALVLQIARELVEDWKVGKSKMLGLAALNADALDKAIRALPPAVPSQPAGQDGDVQRLRAALTDMLAGWRYIRQHHGDLYGVGWDRAENAARAALSAPAPVEGTDDR